MKRLYILRHAQALNTPVGGTDFDRALSPQGLEDSKALGMAMQKKSYAPKLALYSAAKRTTETFENLNIRGIDSIASEDIYDANADRLMDMIHDCDGEHQSLILVGHNPAVQELAMRLASEDSSLSNLQRLMQGYKPGSLSVFDCPCLHWNDIQMAENILTDFLEPLDYNAPDRPTRWM